jgi:hypothetical protein
LSYPRAERTEPLSVNEPLPIQDLCEDLPEDRDPQPRSEEIPVCESA